MTVERGTAGQAWPDRIDRCGRIGVAAALVLLPCLALAEDEVHTAVPLPVAPLALEVDGPAYPVDRFSVEQSYPCLATNRVVSGLVHLFKPQIVAILELRDQTLANWKALHPDRDIYEDRELEITSIVDINIERQIAEIRKARRRTAK